MHSDSTTSAAIDQLETAAKQYRTDRDVVAERVDALNEEIRVMYRRRLPGIRAAVTAAADSKAKLSGLIETHQELFESPKTMTLHGIKFGLKKGSGKIAYECDDETLVARIEKMFAADEAQRDALIIETRAPSKEALRELEAKQLAKLGVEIEGTGNIVVIRAEDTAVDKLVRQILKEGETIEVQPVSTAA